MERAGEDIGSMGEALHFAPATELAARIRDKQVGCLELLDHFLGRAERFNPALNAIIWMDVEAARERARAADAALAKGEVWGPLHGVPMTVKESFNFAGSPTTWGLPAHRDNIPSDHATLVARKLAAGAVIFGKTNVPQHLADWQSFNAIYGTTNNPWNAERTPGGSSGGSAAALAAGLTGLEAGSDIGASIRNPAHYCGIFGHKPTYGLVPPRGQALPGSLAPSDISVVGPMARSAEDLDLSLSIVAGPDVLDEAGWQVALPPPRRERLRDFKVAVMPNDPNSEVQQSYQDRIVEVAEQLAKLGATVSFEARPEIDTYRAFQVYLLLLRAATSRQPDDEAFAEFRKVAEAADSGDEAYYTQMARGITSSHRDWLRLNNERTALRFQWQAFFQDWDLLLCPAAASSAWPHDQAGERYQRTIPVNGKRVPTTDQLFWAGFSGMAYLPSTVSPIGLDEEGLPLGLQAIAGHLQDRTSIAFARLLAQEIGGFQPPPGYD